MREHAAVTLTLSADDDADGEFDGPAKATIVEATSFEPGAGANATSVAVLDNDSVEIRLEAGSSTIEWAGREPSQRWLAYVPVLGP